MDARLWWRKVQSILIAECQTREWETSLWSTPTWSLSQDFLVFCLFKQKMEEAGLKNRLVTFLWLFFFLWPYLRHKEAPRLGLNPSYSVTDVGYFNPLHRAGDLTCTSASTQATAVGFLTHCAVAGPPSGISFCLFFFFFFFCFFLGCSRGIWGFPG